MTFSELPGEPVKAQSASQEQINKAAQEVKEVAVFAVPLFHKGDQVQFVYLPVRPKTGPVDESKMMKYVPAKLQAYATKTQDKMTTAWTAWGQREKGFRRKMHDLGQRQVENVSAGTRLASGIDKKTRHIVVFHPSALSEETAHSQIAAIAEKQGKGHWWKMTAAVVALPFAFAADTFVVIGIPPVLTGYAGYEAWHHYKGATGAKTLKQLTGQPGSGHTAGSAAPSASTAPASATPVPPSAATMPPGSKEMGYPEEAGKPYTGFTPVLFPEVYTHGQSSTATGVPGAAMSSGAAPAESAADAAVAQSVGLEFAVLPALDPFLTRVAERPDDMLSEEDIAELCVLINSTELEKPLQELRRRELRRQNKPVATQAATTSVTQAGTAQSTHAPMGAAAAPQVGVPSPNPGMQAAAPGQSFYPPIGGVAPQAGMYSANPGMQVPAPGNSSNPSGHTIA
jgi:hypothetical protein